MLYEATCLEVHYMPPQASIQLMTALELELVDGRQRVRKRGNLYNLFLKLHYFHENTANRKSFKNKH